MGRRHDGSGTRRTTVTRTLVVMAMTLVTAAAFAAPAAAEGRFWDDDDSVHQRQIEGIADAGITRGCDPPLNSRFCGRAAVTRGQMASFIARTLTLPATGTDYFNDDDGDVHERDINRLAAADLTVGCNPLASTQYCPDAPVTRGQMSAFLTRMYEVPAASTEYFDDDDGSVFENTINAIAAAGITVGCNPPESDRFCPTDRVSRGQVASFLVRADGDLDALSPSRLHERTIEYEVKSIGDVERRDLLARRAQEALYRDNSWHIQHRLLIEQVDDDGDFTLWLTDQDLEDVSASCGAEQYACAVGDDLYIDRNEFVEGPSTYPDTVPGPLHQRFAVLHAVGHWLDFEDTADAGNRSHYNDRRFCVGGRAPVMKQQAGDLSGCVQNAVPLAFERDCVEEAWLADTTNQGDGDGDIDDQCPHEPVER